MVLSVKETKKIRKMFSDTDQTMAATFKVLGDVNRYRIFRILTGQPKLSVSSIARILNISLPLVSQHIKILVNADLLQKERSGKKVYPKLKYNNPFVQAAVKTIQHALTTNRK
ncbi:MAG: metalloregulator ArsR/SmtB family transcription factor [bacterium]|nr:metalloregulator ArsR/SmtB family transcription factor [bacterium]